MEFLTFFGVDVYRLGEGETVVAAVDIEALQARHNPGHGDAPDDKAPPPNGAGVGAMELTEMFEAAPIRVQAELVVAFADRAVARAG